MHGIKYDIYNILFSKDNHRKENIFIENLYKLLITQIYSRVKYINYFLLNSKYQHDYSQLHNTKKPPGGR